MREEPVPSGSVELRDYLRVFRRQLVLILAVTLLGTGAAYTLRRAPVYDSTATVLVRAITNNAFDPGSRVDQQLNMLNQRQLAQSELVAVTKWPAPLETVGLKVVESLPRAATRALTRRRRR
jgi:capsular polysaccharide biosynthesis protein